jgi:integrase
MPNPDRMTAVTIPVSVPEPTDTSSSRTRFNRPVATAVRRQLLEHHSAGAFAAELSAWYELSVLDRGAPAEGWVWPGRSGQPMSPSSVTHIAGRIGRNAGLVDGKGGHIAHAHGLRHSSGSITLSDGVPITVVLSQLRHSRPAFTLAQCSHLLGDAELDRYAAAHDSQTLRETLRGEADEAENREDSAISD